MKQYRYEIRRSTNPDDQVDGFECGNYTVSGVVHYRNADEVREHCENMIPMLEGVYFLRIWLVGLAGERELGQRRYQVSHRSTSPENKDFGTFPGTLHSLLRRGSRHE